MKTTHKIYVVAALTLLSSVMVNAMINHRYSVVEEARATGLSTMEQSYAPSQYVDLTSAADKAVNAVVFIKVLQTTRQQRYNDPFEDFFSEFFGRRQSPRQQEQSQQPHVTGSGSGVIISPDGYIVTNNHVVANADELEIKLNDNREFKGKVVGTDASTDLALVKIDATDLPTLPIGDSDKLKVGQWVLAVGSPLNLTSTVTAGIISAKARQLGANSVESFIQTDAAINPGNSGGALVNERGELIGINAMLYSQTGSYSGYGFAIPTSIMSKVVADLKEYGSVQRAVLGIAGQDVDKYMVAQKIRGVEPDLGTNTGVYVNEVGDNTAAAEAGLKPGDIITGIDGKTVTKMAELQEQMSKHRPGEKISITYIRDKKEHTSKVQLHSIYKRV